MRHAALVVVVTGLLTPVENGSAQSDAGDADSKKIYPISLKCPAANGDVLESVGANREGRNMRLRAHYGNGQVRRIAIEHGNGEKPLSRITEDSDGPNKTDERLFSTWSRIANHLKRIVCEGTPEFQKTYFDKLHDNARKVGVNPKTLR